MELHLSEILGDLPKAKESSAITSAQVEHHYQSRDVVASFLRSFPFQFKNLSLLIQAFTHRSFLHENPWFPIPDNQRLEFLGDSVLQLIITEKLYQLFPDREGVLSKKRGELVNKHTLTSLAVWLKLENYLLLGKGELKVGRTGKGPLADSFEALLGAIYLDQGLPVTQDWLLTLLDSWDREQQKNLWDLDLEDHFDAKTKLQELTHSLYKQNPEYRLVEEGGHGMGPFRVQVYLCGMAILDMQGPSKKETEKKLATTIIQEKLYLLPQSGQKNKN